MKEIINLRIHKTDERQIVYEGPYAWVRDNRDGTWTVYRHGATHATADSTYTERTLAEARARYLDRAASAGR